MLTTLRFEMLSAVLPRFVSLTVFRELLPRSCAPKLSDVGESRTAVPVPVPLRLTVWGLLKALSTRETVAVRIPRAVGVKVTLIWQEALAASELPQFWLKLKSPLFAPVSEMLLMLRA
jgi:hypothetical protein